MSRRLWLETSCSATDAASGGVVGCKHSNGLVAAEIENTGVAQDVVGPDGEIGRAGEWLTMGV